MTDKVGSVKLSCKHDIPIDTKTYNNTDPNAFVSLRVAFNPVFLHFSDLARTEHEVDTFDDYTKHITLCLVITSVKYGTTL